jgi:hypothetical protein
MSEYGCNGIIILVSGHVLKWLYIAEFSTGWRTTGNISCLHTIVFSRNVSSGCWAIVSCLNIIIYCFVWLVDQCFMSEYGITLYIAGIILLVSGTNVMFEYGCI